MVWAKARLRDQGARNCWNGILLVCHHVNPSKRVAWHVLLLRIELVRIVAGAGESIHAKFRGL